MGFRSEIDEEYEMMERDKSIRNAKADAIAKFLGPDMTDEQMIRLEMLRNPDDYDDWGNLRRW